MVCYGNGSVGVRLLKKNEEARLSPASARTTKIIEITMQKTFFRTFFLWRRNTGLGKVKNIRMRLKDKTAWKDKKDRGYSSDPLVCSDD